jgi:hypothetical protein
MPTEVMPAQVLSHGPSPSATPATILEGRSALGTETGKALFAERNRIQDEMVENARQRALARGMGRTGTLESLLGAAGGASRRTASRSRSPPQYRPQVAGAKAPVHGVQKSVKQLKREAANLYHMHHAPTTPLQQRTNLSVQTHAPGVTGDTSYTHLIEGDLAPIGRVHLVSLGPDVGDQRENHILVQMDADSNMGANRLQKRSRRGPFRASSGRSTVMEHTSHVHYRRRGNAMEITVRRGVTDSELSTLIGKLGSHRIATFGAYLYIIMGNSRKKKVGRMTKVSLIKLRRRIVEALEKHKSIGLLIQDTIEKGTLHDSKTHSMETKGMLRGMQI